MEKNKIKDISEFCKLYKINIPIDSEFEYYTYLLRESEEYNKALPNLIEHYVQLEEFVSQNGYKSVREYKNKCMDKLVEYITNTSAYKNMMEADFPKEKLFCRDHMGLVEDGQLLISMDFSSANFNVLRTFDETQSPELNTWKILCESFEIHPALIQSKSFRQIVFGNTSPKRLQTYQHQASLRMLEEIKKEFKIEDSDFVFISHDELIFKIKEPVMVYKFSEFTEVLMKVTNGMPIHVSLFSLNKIKKNTFLKTIYGFEMSDFVKADRGDYSGFNYFENYKTLHGVPGNKFYMYFKKYILNRSLEERDLIYINDGEPCLWIDESVKKKKLPHYEKPNISYTIKEAREEFSYLWNELELRILDISSEEKRRVIELVANTCKKCFSQDNSCLSCKDE